MSTAKILHDLLKRGKALRQLKQIIGKSRQRTAKGPHVKLRAARAEFIRSSQLQAIEIATDRRVCRAEGRTRDHIMGYYNHNRWTNSHGRAATA